MINLITSVRPAVECPVGEDTGKIMSNQTGRKKEQRTSVSRGKRKQVGFVFLSDIPLKDFLSTTPSKHPPVSKHKRRISNLIEPDQGLTSRLLF